MSLYYGKASIWPFTVHKNRCFSYSIDQILETLAHNDHPNCAQDRINRWQYSQPVTKSLSSVSLHFPPYNNQWIMMDPGLVVIYYCTLFSLIKPNSINWHYLMYLWLILFYEELLSLRLVLLYTLRLTESMSADKIESVRPCSQITKSIFINLVFLSIIPFNELNPNVNYGLVSFFFRCPHKRTVCGVEMTRDTRKWSEILCEVLTACYVTVSALKASCKCYMNVMRVWEKALSHPSLSLTLIHFDHSLQLIKKKTYKEKV